MLAFDEIWIRAARLNGGPAALRALLPPDPRPTAGLRALPDDRHLAEMTRQIYLAAFVDRVVASKWEEIEDAFLGFDPSTLCSVGEDYWDAIGRDRRIIRNAAKVAAVRANAEMVREASLAHGGFGAFLANWPEADQSGLMHFFRTRGARLGGATGQKYLRAVGYDGYVLTRSALARLRDAGLAPARRLPTRAELAVIDAQFAAWRRASGLATSQLCALLALTAEPRARAADDGDTVHRFAGGADPGRDDPEREDPGAAAKRP